MQGYALELLWIRHHDPRIRMFLYVFAEKQYHYLLQVLVVRHQLAELALLGLCLARHLDLAKLERGRTLTFCMDITVFLLYGNRLSRGWVVLTQGSITQLPMEYNRIMWHINKHNVAHYLYYYGTIYILMLHINIYNMLQYTIYSATLT